MNCELPMHGSLCGALCTERGPGYIAPEDRLSAAGKSKLNSPTTEICRKCIEACTPGKSPHLNFQWEQGMSLTYYPMMVTKLMILPLLNQEVRLLMLCQCLFLPPNQRRKRTPHSKTFTPLQYQPRDHWEPLV